MAANMDDIRNSMSKDIIALQQEVSQLQKMISAQGTEAYYELRNQAGKAYDNVAPKAKTAATRLRAEGKAVADTAREHTTATLTALAIAGTIGFLAGFVAAGRKQPQIRYWWR